jgi:hypothetical protein
MLAVLPLAIEVSVGPGHKLARADGSGTQLLVLLRPFFALERPSQFFFAGTPSLKVKSIRF